MGNATSARLMQLSRSLQGLIRMVEDPLLNDRTGPDVCDFLLGNPHDPVLPGFVDALQRNAVPHDKDWFAYKMSEPEATTVVCETLNRESGREYKPEHIAMTNGAFAGLAVCLNAVLDPGDEVIFVSPPWFFYEVLIESAGGTPVRVYADRSTFQLDLEAVRAALSPRTRAIIVNSPNNPGGAIYPPEDLAKLGAMLAEASEANGRTIYLLSDEAYRRIVYDGAEYRSPTEFYDPSFLIYTYGKTLLTPGQRLGYIAVNPSMPEPEEVGRAIFFAQTLVGYAFPNALLQHGMADIEKLSIDVPHLQEKRDRMVAALGDFGYETTNPSGTFYIVVKCPWKDDMAFCTMMAEKGVYVLPGSAFELPGYFRISLTANDGMIDRALPVFAEVIDQPES